MGNFGFEIGERGLQERIDAAFVSWESEVQRTIDESEDD
jgi:hypothetical protein